MLEFLPFLVIALGYLAGSFSSAVLVCRWLGLPDPRTQGSGNPGATNVLRHGGKKAALLTLVLDVSKGVMPVLLARALLANEWGWAATALAAYLGHLYPLFFGFKGGKGVATAFGVMLGLAWSVALAMLTTWLFMAWWLRYSSLAALTAALLAPVYAWLLTSSLVITATAALIAAITFWRHSSNIRNLMLGTEHKIGEAR